MIARLLAGSIRLITGVRRQPISTLPSGAAVYFVNHTSHFDFLTVWATLPASIRNRTHPVAAKGYWEKNRLRRWLATSVFKAHLISRRSPGKEGHPLDGLSHFIQQGDSVIIFPEGTRSRDGMIQDFKPGIYHLAKRHPTTPFVPVYLENMNRILPKGERLPIPLLGYIDYRAPLFFTEKESKSAFLHRAKLAVSPPPKSSISDEH